MIIKKMLNFSTITGNLIELALNGEFDVIVHGCNCLSRMGKGLAPQMAKAFGCDEYPMEKSGPSIFKLGCIDYGSGYTHEGGIFYVVNAYTQYDYKRNNNISPIDYEALILCMRKMNVEFKGKHIGLPRIGAGLAGGNWTKIENIIKYELKDCRVTIVNYNK